MPRCSLHFAALFNVEVALCKNLEFIHFWKQKKNLYSEIRALLSFWFEFLLWAFNFVHASAYFNSCFNDFKL